MQVTFRGKSYHIGASERASLADPDPELKAFFAGSTSDSGLAVNEITALNLSAYFSGVRVLSETVGSLPIMTYRRTGSRTKERATDHPIYKLLHDRPNPDMPPSVFKETLMAHQIVWGNAYCEIETDRLNRPVALWPLLPDRTEAERVNKVLRYKTRLNDDREVILPAEKVWHVPGLGWDGVRGWSPLTMHRNAIGLGLALEKFDNTIFANGATLRGVLTMEKGFRDAEKRREYREDFEQIYSGLDNANRVAILEQGMKWTQIGVPPEDSQLLESRLFQVREMARILRLPPHFLGDLADATFSNIEQQGQEFVTYSLRPYLVKWEESLHYRLFDAREREQMFPEFLVDALLRGDIDSRYKAYQTAITYGFLSPNDVRGLENMNPVEGGDQYFVPVNIMPIDQIADAGAGAQVDAGTGAGAQGGELDEAALKALGAGPGTRRADFPADTRADSTTVRERLRVLNSFERLVADKADMAVKREVQAVRRAIGKMDTQDFRDWMREWYAGHQPWLVRQFRPVMVTLAQQVFESAAREINLDEDFGDDEIAFTRAYVDSMAVRITSSSQGQLRKIMNEVPEEEVQTALNERVDDWEGKRAGKITKRELVQIGGAIARLAFQRGGVTEMVWVTIGENCKLCQKMSGRTVEISGAFLNPGDRVNPEDEDTAPLEVTQRFAHPPLHQGCDCTVGPG